MRDMPVCYFVRLCDCMWVWFDPRERTICGLATVAGGRGAVVGLAHERRRQCPIWNSVQWNERCQKLNSTVVVYKSKTKPGYVYRFNHKKGDEYVCCRCRELGKYRAIRLRNDVVVGRKDPKTHIVRSHIGVKPT